MHGLYGESCTPGTFQGPDLTWSDLWKWKIENQKQLSDILLEYDRPPGELGVSKSMECDISLQCFDTGGWATGRSSSL